MALFGSHFCRIPRAIAILSAAFASFTREVVSFLSFLLTWRDPLAFLARISTETLAPILGRSEVYAFRSRIAQRQWSGHGQQPFSMALAA